MAYPGRLRKVVYVDPTTGTLNGPGTWKNPVTRISTAIKIVGNSGGGVIRVRSTSGAPVTEPSNVLTFYSSTDIEVESWDNTDWYLTGQLRCYGDGLVTLRHGIIASTAVAGSVLVGVAAGNSGTTGRLVAENCSATNSSSGSAWATDNVWTSMDLTFCYGHSDGNDGFGIHATTGLTPVATLTNCEAASCIQEGASNHNDTIMNIVGGSYHDNGESGMHVIGNGVCNISGGASFYNNGALGNTGTIGNAGARYRDNSSGSIDGATFTNNVGPGVDLDTTGTVTLGAYTSTGNGLPDDLT